MREVKIGNIKIGGANPIVLISGPCVIESEESALFHATEIKKIAARIGIPFIFKSSYDKANRTSVSSYRGPGPEEGLRILKKVKEKTGVPVLSDIHAKEEAKKAAEVLDVIQIPALLSRQTDIITAAAKTGRPVNIKKGQFSSPWEVKYAVEKINSAGNGSVLITERGTSFGYNNLVSDFRSLAIIKEMEVPVIYDASHSVQMPGGLGGRSGGERRFIGPLLCAASAVGADGMFIEVHDSPDKALCDGPNMLALAELEGVLRRAAEISKIARRR